MVAEEHSEAERMSFRLSGVLPEPDDNVAIAAQVLPAGTVIEHPDGDFTLAHTVREGHRFVVTPIAAGAPLLSWQTPFARALRDLAPGDYVCTETSLQTLAARGLDGLPDQPAAANETLDAFELDESALVFGDQVSLEPGDPTAADTFAGYRRANGRAGIRNHIAIIGATSREAAFVTEVARRFAGRRSDTFDGVVPVAHTEAGEATVPENLPFVLSVLAGCLVHPNLGGVLFVDGTGGQVSAAMVQHTLAERGGTIVAEHAFFTRTGSFSDDVAAAVQIVEQWIEPVSAAVRVPCPVADIAIGLQCGGSDAFSGVSANPLAGQVGAEVIKRGGLACLAETDELIGAEPYVLSNVRDLGTARRFVERLEEFKQRVGRHGSTAEGNPSGGNVFRGLYNIVLKSIGAARKLPRDVRLDHVIEYGQPLPESGYVFMDSPGNDLESVAGQVGSGCNLIFFTTGNGSVTNFPFVPTLKFVTTSGRFDLLRHDMDIDAGRYLTGTPMAELTEEVYRHTLDVASGQRTVGERAGHSQVSIWRTWRQPETASAASPTLLTLGRRPTSPMASPAALAGQADPNRPGEPLPFTVPAVEALTLPDLRLRRNDRRSAGEAVALVLPTSLCSGQIADRIAREAEDQNWSGGRADRVVALPHTEGCGVTSGDAELIYTRTMLSYLAHPNVRWALLLEHGCEKTHNDYFQNALRAAGVDTSRYGYASIQADGGIGSVSERVHDWFDAVVADDDVPQRITGRAGDLVVALASNAPAAPETAQALARLARGVVAAGGSVVQMANDALLSDPVFCEAAFAGPVPGGPTLAHGQRIDRPGWHLMRGLSTDWLENLTGLAAAGSHVVLAACGERAATGHRLVPVLRINAAAPQIAPDDLDTVLAGDADERLAALTGLLSDTLSGRRRAQAADQRDVGFQITRGLLGVSM